MRRKQSTTVDLKVRMKEPLRASIERAAKKRGISLNAEAVDRLERSFDRDAELGGPATAALLRLFAAGAGVVEAQTGRRMLSDYETFRAVMNRWQRIIEEYAPRPSGELGRLEAELEAERAKVGPARDEQRIRTLEDERRREENRIWRRASEIAQAAADQARQTDSS